MRLPLVSSFQVLGALLLASCPATAEPTSAPSIQLAEALARAESHSAEVLLARERLVREQAEIGALGALWKPSVSAFAAVIAATVNNSTATTLAAGGVEFPRIGATRITDEPSFRPYASTIVGVSGRQLVADFGRTSLLRESAEARLPVESARADLARLDARGEAADAFFAELAAEAITKVTAAAVERARARRELVLANTAAGMFPPATKTLAEAEVARFELTHQRALGAAKAARIVLAASVVAEKTELSAAEPGREALTALPSEETLVRQAVEQHPTLRAARAEIVARHAAVRATGALARPTLFVTAGVTGRAGGAPPSAGPALPGEGFVPLMPNYHAGVVLAGPLYDPTVGARRDIAAAEEGIARRALEAARIRIVTRTLRARTDVELADGQIDALGRTRDAAVKNFEQADARFRAGLGSAVELADAESRRVEAEIQLAAGVYDRLRARAALERAIGAPLDRARPLGTSAAAPEVRP